MLAKTKSWKPAGQLQFELDGMIAEFSGSQSYLEIGARYGDTFYDVMMSLPVGSLGVCVEMPESVWGSKGTFPYLKSACLDLIKSGYDIKLIAGNSRDRNVVDQVMSFGMFDCCLIDADHRYEGVKADYHTYGPCAKKVAFHDIVGHGQRHARGIDVEVPRFWQEIKKDDSVEIIAPRSKMGVGIV